jgi:hypothetical protein
MTFSIAELFLLLCVVVLAFLLMRNQAKANMDRAIVVKVLDGLIDNRLKLYRDKEGHPQVREANQGE